MPPFKTAPSGSGGMLATPTATAEGPGAPYVPVPGNPGLYYIPGTNYVIQYSAGDRFNPPKLDPLPLSVGKSLLGDLATSDADGGVSYPPAHADPRYWELAFAELGLDWAKLSQDDKQFIQDLALRAQNTGLDADAARQQVLGSLIINRNNNSVDIAQTSANVAKTIAEFAANPRDAVAELMYRNQVGGSTPFGDLTNNNFGEYGKALADKAQSIFQPVGQDLQQARIFNQSIPPTEFFGAETRQQLGLQPTAAQALAGGGGGSGSIAGSPQAPANGLQALMTQLQNMTPQQQNDFQRWTTIGSGHGWLAPQPLAPAPVAAPVPPPNPLQGKLPKFDMGGMINARTDVGDAPTSTEGGLNLNLFEPAVVVGMDSGKVYATLAEPRPDGTRRGEQLVVKPLKSEVEKDKKLAEGKKAVTQSFGVPKAAQGGTINSTPDDFMEQLRQYLGSLGGAGGGTGGVSTPLQSPRLLAGDPYNRLLEDPDAMAYTQAGYSALGISPNNLQASIRKFTPNAPINNTPRVNWI